MVRPTEWRRENMSMSEENSSAWVADGHIQLNENETLGGLWVSTTGLVSSFIATEIDPPQAQHPYDMPWRPRVLRLGLLWVDNPLTILDPLSSIADALWIHAAQLTWQVSAFQYPDPLGSAGFFSHAQWIASHNTANEKVEGQRRVPPGETRYITFNGSEQIASISPALLSAQTAMHAVVSALVILPEAA